MKYFEKSLGVAKANGDSKLITRAESMITMVRGNMGEAEHVKASLRKQKKLYEAEDKKGESAVDTIPCL